MPTIVSQLEDLRCCLCQTDSFDSGYTIPPQILETTVGFFYFGKLNKGFLNPSFNKGLLFIRNAVGKWSTPVAFQFLKGHSYYGSSATIRCADVFLTLNDRSLVETLLRDDKIELNSMKTVGKGICLKKKDQRYEKYERIYVKKKYGPSHRAFLYGARKGGFFSVDIEDPVLSIRQTSNQRFYPRNYGSTLMKVVRWDSRYVEKKHAFLVSQVLEMISQFFDVNARFPTYSSFCKKNLIASPLRYELKVEDDTEKAKQKMHKGLSGAYFVVDTHPDDQLEAYKARAIANYHSKKMKTIPLNRSFVFDNTC